MAEDRIRQERSPVRSHGLVLKQLRPAKMLRFRSRNDVINEREHGADDADDSDWESVCGEDDDTNSQPITTILPAQHSIPTKIYRLGLFSLALALMLPLLQFNPISRIGVRGGVIPENLIESNAEGARLLRREDSPTDVCKRWSGQSTIVNGTLYMYGFRTKTDAKQSADTWSTLSPALLFAATYQC